MPSKKKNGLFSDINHISFNTHPPPPNDDIWQKWLGVGKFTTYPPLRNNDIFLKKGVFEKIFEQLNFKDISALFFEALPYLKLTLRARKRFEWWGWCGGFIVSTIDHAIKLLPTWSSEGKNTTLKVYFEIVTSSLDTYLNDMSLFLRLQEIVISARYPPTLLIDVIK